MTSEKSYKKPDTPKIELGKPYRREEFGTFGLTKAGTFADLLIFKNDTEFFLVSIIDHDHVVITHRYT